MSIQIHSFDKNKFPFDDVTLANPQGLQGGAFFSRLKLLGDSITVQTPKCKTKNGIVKTEKKIYCDLMFSKDDEDVGEFLETIEDKIKNLIYEKRDKWFHSDMDMDTIDYHWQNILRSYKGNHILLRCFIRRPKSRLNSEPTVQIYDEDERLLALDDITKDKSIMALLEITGLKFTSQSFSLEFNLTQAMILKEKVFRNKCMIKQTFKNEPTEKTSLDIDAKKNVLNTDEFKSIDESEVEGNIEPDVVKAVAVEENIEPDVVKAVAVEENIEHDVVKAVAVEENIEHDVVKAAAVEDIDKNIPKDNVVEEKQDSLVTRDVNTNLKDTESKHLAKSVQPLKENNDEVRDNNIMVNVEPLEKNEELNEINLVMPEDKEAVQLKKPNEVYLEIYRAVKKRAKEAKKRAIETYLEAKRIKSLYLLDDIESSDDENELLEMTIQ